MFRYTSNTKNKNTCVQFTSIWCKCILSVVKGLLLRSVWHTVCLQKYLCVAQIAFTEADIQLVDFYFDLCLLIFTMWFEFTYWTRIEITIPFSNRPYPMSFHEVADNKCNKKFVSRPVRILYKVYYAIWLSSKICAISFFSRHNLGAYCLH